MAPGRIGGGKGDAVRAGRHQGGHGVGTHGERRGRPDAAVAPGDQDVLAPERLDRAAGDQRGHVALGPGDESEVARGVLVLRRHQPDLALARQLDHVDERAVAVPDREPLAVGGQCYGEGLPGVLEAPGPRRISIGLAQVEDPHLRLVGDGHQQIVTDRQRRHRPGEILVEPLALGAAQLDASGAVGHREAAPVRSKADLDRCAGELLDAPQKVATGGVDQVE